MLYLKILGPPELSMDGQPVRLFKKPMEAVAKLPNFQKIMVTKKVMYIF